MKPKKKRKKSRMTKVEKTDEIQSIDATPQEVLEAIFRAADGDPKAPNQEDNSKSAKCGDNECPTGHE